MPWSRWSVSAAIASEGMLPSCQVRIMRYFAPRLAVLAALDVQRRSLVQLLGRVPGGEVDLVVHQALGAEHAHREDAGRGPARAYIADLAVGEPKEVHRLVVDFRAERRELGGNRARCDHVDAEIAQHIEVR